MASARIRCIVIGVPSAAAPRLRPSQMLPWDDPYIAALVRKCQQEVAAERRQKLMDMLKFVPRAEVRAKRPRPVAAEAALGAGDPRCKPR